MGRRRGHGRDKVVYGAMGRAHEQRGGVRGDGKGAGGIRWCMGRLKARMWHRVLYGAKERTREGWGGVWCNGKSVGGMG